MADDDTASPRGEKRRGPMFKLQFPGSPDVKDLCIAKIKRVKSSLSDDHPNNTDVLSRTLDFWIANNAADDDDDVFEPEIPIHNTYLGVRRDDTLQDLQMTTVDASQNLVTTSEVHARMCSKLLTVRDSTMRGGVAILQLRCDAGHSYTISSSPYLPNGRHLVNVRLLHAYLCSGLLPSQWESVCNSLGFSEIKLDTFDYFAQATSAEKTESCEIALKEEIGLSFEQNGEIDIVTDARHGCRKNANDANVICIGNKTHKVLADAHVTRADDPVSQRHELLGTKRIYEFFDSEPDCIQGPVNVNIHAHDRNMSVNKFIREQRPDTVNQNDTWHAAKYVQKDIAKVAKGPKYAHGKTWHTKISDKVNSIRTHVQYSMRNCNGDAEHLRASLDNIVPHYKNDHRNCSESSRCKTDGNYEPSKQNLIIQSQRAEQLLRDAIRKTVVYKNAEDFTHAMDTFYVESFNNVLNVYLDKRIFSDELATACEQT